MTIIIVFKKQSSSTKTTFTITPKKYFKYSKTFVIVALKTILTNNIKINIRIISKANLNVYYNSSKKRFRHSKIIIIIISKKWSNNSKITI